MTLQSNMVQLFSYQINLGGKKNYFRNSLQDQQVGISLYMRCKGNVHKKCHMCKINPPLLIVDSGGRNCKILWPLLRKVLKNWRFTPFKNALGRMINIQVKFIFHLIIPKPIHMFESFFLHVRNSKNKICSRLLYVLPRPT